MGVFGKKENKIPEGSAADSKALEVATVKTSSDSSDLKNNLQSWVTSVKNNYNSWKNKSCEWCESPQMKEIRQKRKEFAQSFCHPLGDFYRDFPEELTAFKWSAFGKYNYRERLFGLEALTLLTAIVTLRVRTNQLGFGNRFMLAIRNSSVTFFLSGLLLAPEIYNPLIKSDF